ncbi:D-alanyl-D-alanine carboxypeptidase family protein [Okeania sp. SIO2C2]|uniref:M15 family metallopeptidase n=1 Tax=Okeania sp. SIO2C2 TaxID=2607787 RepID=UPI00257C079C|nr:D-alanyl-D-alanine carboxypeptidase family protein [Okeania sp. SIO2C2]
MHNESLSENLSLVQETVADDIPEAVRDPQKDEEIIPAQSQSKKWMWGWIGIVVVVGAVSLGLQLQSNLNQVNASSTQTEVDNANTVATSSVNETPINELKKDTLLDFTYSQVSEMELEYITSDSEIRLQINAVKNFQKMLYAARNDGINLVALRGFQSKSELKDWASNTNNIEDHHTNNANQISPFSYGEYVTGYAVDIGDGNAPATNQNVEFEKTVAFQWLQNYAAYFSFEMIPTDDEKNIGYEPWHWRYVGDRHSLETFYKNQPNIVSEESELILEDTELIEEGRSKKEEEIDGDSNMNQL